MAKVLWIIPTPRLQRSTPCPHAWQARFDPGYLHKKMKSKENLAGNATMPVSLRAVFSTKMGSHDPFSHLICLLAPISISISYQPKEKVTVYQQSAASLPVATDHPLGCRRTPRYRLRPRALHHQCRIEIGYANEHQIDRHSVRQLIRRHRWFPLHLVAPRHRELLGPGLALPTVCLR